MKRANRFLIHVTALQKILLGAALVFSVSSFASNPNAPVQIADVPLFVDPTNLVPVNVLLLADDSGSMAWTHAPEGIGDVEKACWRGADGVLGGVYFCSPSDPKCLTMDVCGYPYPNPYPDADPKKVKEKAVQVLPPPLMAAGFNKMAYHPEATYLPPVIEDKNGNKVHFPSMKEASKGWTAVGWPDSFEGIARPKGVPVTINMRDVGSEFPAARTYLPDQRFSLQLRYMHGAGEAQLEQLAQLKEVTPMHYYKTSIKWCRYYQSVSTTADGNPVTPPAFYEGTLFLGSASAQDCQDDRTAQYKYPYYYFPNGKYTTPNKEDHTKYPSFELVVLDYAKSNGAPIEYTVVDEHGVLQTKSRTYAEELENYANWYAYYSNRTAATRTVATFALAGIAPERWLKMGVAMVNKNDIGSLIDVKKGVKTVGNKYQIYKTLLEHEVDTVANLGTPLKTAMDRVRSKFAEDKNFIVHSCQRNYVVALTDGLWNDDAFSKRGNQDLRLTSSPPKPVNVLGENLVNAMFWPRPIREGSKEASNTLSDVSIYAWLEDLRSDFIAFDVDQTETDPASWRHLNTLALSYAGEGSLPTGDPQKTLAEITANLKEWPLPLKNEPAAIDDLWHAAVSGFGGFTTGIDPEKFKRAIEGGNDGNMGLGNVLNRGGTFSETGLPPSRDLKKDGAYSYNASFSPNWAGTVQKREIKDNFEASAPVWDAAEKLAAKMAVKTAPPPAWAKREIFTGTGKKQIPFTFSDLTESASAYLAALGASPAEQEKIIAYLRGDNSLEESFAGGKYRQRAGVLGDFVHASPVVVDAPGFLYDEIKNPGYEGFKKDQKKRKRMIYAAGNDGMLHAFDDDGNEQWAFIPPELFRSAVDKGIVNLTRSRDEGWAHYFYVDATPRVVDVDVGIGHAPDPEWRTMLIGGMGKGGTAFYALDVTKGDDLSSGATFFSWTFTDENMGHTYGQALMVKTAAWGGKWVAILPSGINNGEGPGQPKKGDGRGRIFFVDLKTGDKLGEIDTGEGEKAAPSGLAYIRAFVEGSHNQLADAVYGGDQLGNFWRFDLKDADPKKWKAVKLAELRNREGEALPVNTEPRMEVTGNVNGSDDQTTRWVMVGTGRFYDEKDVYDKDAETFPKTEQGMFAFKDGTRDKPSDDTKLFPYRLGDLEDITGKTAPGNFSGKKGWVNFLPEGYQIITNPDSLLQHVAYVANRYVPSGTEGLDACATSPFEALFYQRKADTGSALTHGGSTGHDYYDHYFGGLSSARYFKDRDGSFKILLANRQQNPATKKIDPKLPGLGGGSGEPRRSSIRYISQ